MQAEGIGCRTGKASTAVSPCSRRRQSSQWDSWSAPIARLSLPHRGTEPPTRPPPHGTLPTQRRSSHPRPPIRDPLVSGR
eukprot:318816-Rhodomonas_salina.2